MTRTMNTRSMYGFPAERLHSSRIHGYLMLSDCCQHTSRIGRGPLKRGIPVNGADSQKLQRVMMRRNENGKCILCALNVSCLKWVS